MPSQPSTRNRPVAEASLRRLPLYYRCLRQRQAEGHTRVSCSLLSRELGFEATQIRKDIESTGIVGKPKTGYSVAELVQAIEDFLGWTHKKSALLAGTGVAADALLGLDHFEMHGFRVTAVFDADASKIGSKYFGLEVLGLDKLADVARRRHIHLGVITTPAAEAQHVADLMVEAGIRAIWNFAPVQLRVPDYVILQQEVLYPSLSSLSFKLGQRLMNDAHSHTDHDIMTTKTELIDTNAIHHTLAAARREASAETTRAVLAKARQCKGLSAAETAALVYNDDAELLADMFDAARQVHQSVFHNSLSLFAPIYISNFCRNECRYCGFRVRNASMRRRSLSVEEIADLARTLIEQGHNRILLVCAEAFPERHWLHTVLAAVPAIHAVAASAGRSVRVDVNLPPLEVDEFERLRAAGIGCYEMLQESYHRETYQTVHVSGPKRDYDYRLATMHRAMEGGIQHVGIGALFGLYDWGYEVIGLVEHARSLEAEFGRGPETISVPRVEPAPGSDFSLHPAAPVNDADFLKVIAMLRLAVPHAGIVLSTNEMGEFRHEALSLGVTHLQAGRRCEDVNPDPDFQAGDARELPQVVTELESEGCLLA